MAQTITKLRSRLRCAIYENNYDTTVEKVSRLTALARQDFPRLKDEDIEVVVYAGERIKYHMGVEFAVTMDELPYTTKYQPVRNFEHLLF